MPVNIKPIDPSMTIDEIAAAIDANVAEYLYGDIERLRSIANGEVAINEQDMHFLRGMCSMILSKWHMDQHLLNGGAR